MRRLAVKPLDDLSISQILTSGDGQPQSIRRADPLEESPATRWMALGQVISVLDFSMVRVVATVGDAIRATISTIGGLATIVLTTFGIYEAVKRLRASRPKQPVSTPIRILEHIRGTTVQPPNRPPPAIGRTLRQPRSRVPPQGAASWPKAAPPPVKAEPTVAVAVASWIIGSIIAIIGAYVASRLVGVVVHRLELVLPAETSFRSPWTWLICAGFGVLLMGGIAVIAYEEFESDAGVLAISLFALLALPASFFAIGVAEGLGWAIFHFVHFNYAVVAWPTFLLTWVAFSSSVLSGL